MEQFVFLLFILLLLILISITRWIRNENSAVRSESATIVDMRKKKHLRAHYRSYHVTFQLESGEQIELRVKRNEYNEMTVGCRGVLTHQGTRFKGFERT